MEQGRWRAAASAAGVGRTGGGSPQIQGRLRAAGARRPQWLRKEVQGRRRLRGKHPTARTAAKRGRRSPRDAVLPCNALQHGQRHTHGLGCLLCRHVEPAEGGGEGRRERRRHVWVWRGEQARRHRPTAAGWLRAAQLGRTCCGRAEGRAEAAQQTLGSAPRQGRVRLWAGRRARESPCLPECSHHAANSSPVISEGSRPFRAAGPARTG